MFEQIDPSRVPVLLLLLGAGLFLPTLLVRPGPRGSERLPAEQHSRRVRSFALRGMWGMTLAGLCSGLAGGLLESALGESALVLVLHGIYWVCWLPPHLMRELQRALGVLGITELGQLPALLGLLLLPVFWFVVFFAAGRWLGRRSGR